MAKILIIGAGPAGATAARIFADNGFDVDVFDQRPHVAGNCFDRYDEHGILVHAYGPHYFRTNSKELLDWLSQFTQWIPGEYYVEAKIFERTVPLPISIATVEALHGKSYTEESFLEYLKQQRKFDENYVAQNAEEQCLQLVGSELYEKIFKNYTIKQWGHHPRDLRPEVTARIPLRMNRDTRYPSETYQCLPKDGYTQMFQKMLEHPKIHLHLNEKINSQDIHKLRSQYLFTMYSGAIDEFFNFTYGPLKYRSLKFEWKHFANTDFYQPHVQMNFPNEHEFTRCVEMKHATKQAHSGTTICLEYSSAEGEPYYPMPLTRQEQLYQKYKLLADQESHQQEHPIYFLGRLAEYKYYNMDHIFLRSMNWSKEKLNSLSGK